MNIRIFILAALMAAATTQASAQTRSGFADSPRWYASLGLGYNAPSDVSSHSLKAAPDGKPLDWDWRLGNNFAVVATIGYRVSKHFRTEIQSGYFQSKLLSVHAPGPDVGGFSQGRPSAIWGLCAIQSQLPKCLAVSQEANNKTFLWSGFLDVIYDILPGHKIDPFVGVGGGMAHIEWAGSWQTYLFSGVPGPISSTNPAVQRFKDAGTLLHPNQLAVQLLAGISYPISRRFKLDVTYYYYFTPGSPIWNPLNTTPGLPPHGGVQTGDFQGHIRDSSVLVSLRYAF